MGSDSGSGSFSFESEGEWDGAVPDGVTDDALRAALVRIALREEEEEAAAAAQGTAADGTEPDFSAWASASTERTEPVTSAFVVSAAQKRADETSRGKAPWLNSQDVRELLFLEGYRWDAWGDRRVSDADAFHASLVARPV